MTFRPRQGSAVTPTPSRVAHLEEYHAEYLSDSALLEAAASQLGNRGLVVCPAKNFIPLSSKKCTPSDESQPRKPSQPQRKRR